MMLQTKLAPYTWGMMSNSVFVPPSVYLSPVTNEQTDIYDRYVMRNICGSNVIVHSIVSILDKLQW